MALRTLAIVALATAAIPVFAVSSATATTLEIGEATQNKAVTFTWSQESGLSSTLGRTDGTQTTTCTEMDASGTTFSPFTGHIVAASISTLTFECNHEITVHKAGQFYFTHASGTTSAKTFMKGTELTVPTTLGFTVTCKTGEGTEVGTLTGVKSGSAKVDINAVLNCGFLLPSASWKGTFILTSPPGLGVSP